MIDSSRSLRDSESGASSALPFAIPIAASALLLFLVQPIAARAILPWFGGSPAVWTACLLFFQTALFVGYGWAHVLAGLSPRVRFALHGALLAASLATAPFAPRIGFVPEASESPLAGVAGVLLILATSVGPPFVALAATSPLVQRIASELRPGRNPYRFTALSNAGSLVGLLMFPVLVEPWVGVIDQRRWFLAGYVGFALAMLCVLWLGVRAGRRGVDGASGAPSENTAASRSASPAWRPSGARVALWFALTMLPSLLLAATTVELTSEVAAVPFLWVLPLAIYVVTFVIAFESEWFRRRAVTHVLLFVAVAAFCYVRTAKPLPPLPIQIALAASIVFGPALACHAELARLAPDARSLTRFHLTIAGGGALGAALAALVAPWVFDRPRELAIAVGGCVLAVLWAREWSIAGADRGARRSASPAAVAIHLGCIVAVMCVGVAEQRADVRNARNVLLEHRDFFGILRVVRDPSGGIPLDYLVSGRTQHGIQILDPARSLEPTSYYCEGSGSYRAIENHPKRRAGLPLRIGAIGLGIGTIAGQTREGDTIRFYELSPAIERIAREHFAFLNGARGRVEVALGDARLSLQRELAEGRAQEFDVFVLDAFAGDSIPRHLLTTEAFALYARHLAKDATLAVHVSNRYLELRALARALAESLGFESRYLAVRATPGVRYRVESKWVLARGGPDPFADSGWNGAFEPWPADLAPMRAWTDDFGGLWSIVKW